MWRARESLRLPLSLLIARHARRHWIASERGQRTLRSGPPERRAFSHLSCQLFLCAGFRPPAIDVALVDHLALVIEPDRSEIAPRRSLIEGLLDYPVDFFPYNVWVGGELGLYSLARGVV